ncbi:MAG: fatty acid desaturase [Leptospiraceae bacterium]|nr:fatty acid desaturase [Leptospiraceae bacterium]
MNLAKKNSSIHGVEKEKEQFSQGLPYTKADAFGNEIRDVYKNIKSKNQVEDLKYMQKMTRLSGKLHNRGREKIEKAKDFKSWIRGILMLGGHYTMEFAIGHMVMHGCYDDIPRSELQSKNWKWNNSMVEEDWITEHNQFHHIYTNIVEQDHDFGFLMFRLSDKQKWKPYHLFQVISLLSMPLYLTPYMAWYITTARAQNEKRSLFQWDLYTKPIQKTLEIWLENYWRYPLQSENGFFKVALGNFLAKLYADTVFVYMIGVEHLNDNLANYEVVPDATIGEFYLRQILTTLNYYVDQRFEDVFLGGINIHTEHHLFPDLPPNRLREASQMVESICKKYKIPYRSLHWSEAIIELLYTGVKYSFPFSKQINKQFELVWKSMTQPLTNVFLKQNKETTYTAKLIKSQKEILLSSNKTILESLEENGLKPSVGCRKGACRKCVVQKLSGRTTLETDGGNIKICIAKPISDMILEL